MSNIKKVHGKPRLYVSVNLLFGVWPSSCATPPSERAELENPKLTEQVHSARENNVADSQLPRTSTNPHSTTLRTQES